MRPIIIIGAGGIVNDAHLPAYKIAGYEVAGIYDVDIEKARSTAERFSIASVFQDMRSAVSTNAIFDIAVPGVEMLNVLKQLPNNSAALLQKPMGHNYAEAKQILQLTREKKMIAAVNFQLRYAPYILEAKRIMNDIGELCDIEVNVNVYTPWHLWKFLYDLPRTEILYHSIHYIDLIRSLLGNPQSIYAKTVKHPGQKDFSKGMPLSRFRPPLA